MPDEKPDFCQANTPDDTVHTKASPILRIPPELLSEIFSRCLPEDGLPRPHPNEAPLLPCQICSFFRTVALSSPNLWAGISIIRNTERNGDALTLDLWIKRSGSCPLSFSLEYRGAAFNIDKLIDSLAPYSSRWKDVTVGFARDLVLPNFIQAMSRGPSALEKLTIKSTETDKFVGFLAGRSTGTPTILNVSLANSLTEITIEIQMNFQLDFCSAVLNSVKEISIISHTWIWIYAHRIFHCLEHCPAVAKFACEGKLIDVSGLENVKPLTLPFLEQFHINAGNWNPHAIFDKLCLPGLLNLSFGCSGGSNVRTGIQSITYMLKRSCALVEILSITGLRLDQFVNPNVLIDCLEQAPRLKNFKCDFRMDLVAQVLTLTSTSQLCLELESVTLFGDMETDLPVLGEMIFSRWCIPLSDEGFDLGLGGGHRLAKVMIRGDVKRKQCLKIPAIALCVAEGLELHCDPRHSINNLL
ncbi:hypothetical protein BD410DRAFT_789168 [Rickenella mellea]|uniref:F-box domain-containing protein n=1 Tax=Rickenella mellea TaxID=50990 RepID=A0A4Y7Q2A3_9AGAM|nr:hypothetical protein BD410DRAFT_789168 [Rickenella mellea]